MRQAKEAQATHGDAGNARAHNSTSPAGAQYSSRAHDGRAQEDMILDCYSLSAVVTR